MGAPDLNKETSIATVLLAEDSGLSSNLESSYMSSVGFNVLSASTPAQVDSILRKQHVDLLLIDVSFAGDQGLQIVKEVRRSFSSENLKILVTSIISNPDLKKQSAAYGANDFIEKPTPRPKLLKELKKLTAQAPRGNERVIQKLEVLAHGNGTTVHLVTLNVSSDGMHLGSDEEHAPPTQPIPIGTKLNLEVKIGKNEKPLLLTGTVVRHTSQGIGVRFEDLGKQQRRLLDRFLIRSSVELKASQFYL